MLNVLSIDGSSCQLPREPFGSFSAFRAMSSAKRMLVISRPPMLTLSSWSSSASHMILSRKMLKRVGERRHPCRTPTVVLNHSPVLPLKVSQHNYLPCLWVKLGFMRLKKIVLRSSVIVHFLLPQNY